MTTLALRAVAATQAARGRALWLDLPATLDPYAAARQGVDLPRLLLVRPQSGAEALALLEDVVAGRAARLVVVGGASQLPAAALEGALPRLVHAARASHCVLLWLLDVAPGVAPLPGLRLALHLAAEVTLDAGALAYSVTATLQRGPTRTTPPPLRFALRP